MRRWQLCVLLLAACAPTEFPRQTRAANARNGDPWLEGRECPAEGVAPGSLRIEEIVAGAGLPVQDGETVRVHYLATLATGETVHASRDSGLPVELVIGSQRTVCGFDRALVGMRPGGQRKVTVPAKLAFADAGRAPNVPSNADVVFVIDLYLPADNAREPHAAPANPGQRRR
jgi:FKBP-type peptidyl-prolyl cis-trans isomerase